MKIKGVIKNLKFFLKIVSDKRKKYIGISLELLRAMWGSVQFQRILLLKVYRPLPM